MARRFGRRTIELGSQHPIICFTFDDAPASAFRVAGRLLQTCGIRSTYFVSLGLLGMSTEVGTIATAGELEQAIAEGNELGCHTFDHLDAWDVTTEDYLRSIEQNREALVKLLPQARFRTFAYPKSGARLAVKPHLQKLFAGCRGGGQVPNIGTADLNLLSACFLDSRQNIDVGDVTRLIGDTVQHRGWLIFATHDVADRPSPFGCSTAFFASVVDLVVRSGAMIMPLGEACDTLAPAHASELAGA